MCSSKAAKSSMSKARVPSLLHRGNIFEPSIALPGAALPRVLLRRSAASNEPLMHIEALELARRAVLLP